MVRKLRVLLAVLVTALGLMVPTATSASALGGEWLGCWTYPIGQPYYQDMCVTGSSNSQVIIDFVVQDETAPSTYSWAIPAGYATYINAGCTSSTNYCQLKVHRGAQEIVMSVTLYQGGATATLTSYVYVEPMCGTQWC